LEAVFIWSYFLSLLWLAFLKKETKFWNSIKKNTQHLIHWTRIESWAGQGIPDLHGIRQGKTVFVELKVIESDRINLSPFQIAWNYKHVSQGGRSFIMLQDLRGRSLYIFPCFLLHCSTSITLKSKPHYKVSWPLASPAAWAAVVDHLFEFPFPLPKNNTKRNA
tara:strand:+ start:429 stop:920 length:492 start_codon:yes stop_codon:yes gene_type:complete